MSITLKTGAFGPVIPFELANQREHNVFQDADQTLRLLVEASNIQTDQEPPDPLAEIDGRMLLDLMWTIKTFDIKSSFQYAPIDFFFETVQFLPTASGEYTYENVDILFFDSYIPVGASGASGGFEAHPTFPWLNSPLLAAMKYTFYVEAPYPADRNQARQLIRNFIQNFGIISFFGPRFDVRPTKNYDDQRAQLEAGFEAEWQKWIDEVTPLRDAFLNDLSIRGKKLKDEFQRQLDVIPTIKPIYESMLETRLSTLDQQKNNPATTAEQLHILIQQLAETEIIFQDHIRSERNLEMFDLAGGFKNQIKFQEWNKSQLMSYYGYPRSNFGGFPAAINGRAAIIGATGEAEQKRKHQHDGAAFLIESVFSSFESFTYQNTTAQEYDDRLSEPLGQVDVANFLLTRFIPNLLNVPYGSYTYGLSLSKTRCFEKIKFGAYGYLSGGNVIDSDGRLSSIDFSYEQFFNSEGNLRPESEFPPFLDFTPGLVGVELPEGINSWNDIIYSGILEYGNYAPIIAFFEQLASLIRAAQTGDPQIDEVGKFRILNEQGALIVEVPLFGSKILFQSVNIEYKIKQRWDLSGASGASAP